MSESIYTLYTLTSTFHDMNGSIPASEQKTEIMLKMCDEVEKQLNLVKKELIDLGKSGGRTHKTMFDFGEGD